MTEFTTLVEGYAYERSHVLYASPTTVLIQDHGLSILVDPGASPQRLLSAFEQHDLDLPDIDLIFLTHHHLDHLLNIRLFPNVDVYDGYTINRGDQIRSYSGQIPGTDLQILPTPGHTTEHWSLLMQTRQGKVAIAGDVFWWYDDQSPTLNEQNLLSLVDPYVEDMEALSASRRQLLNVADWIIPGHGGLFEVPR